MELYNFDFSKLETVKKRCIVYAKDGNTVVKHWKELYPVESITQHPEFKGLYLEIVKNDYNTDYRFYNDLGKDLILYDWISGWKDVEKEVIEQLVQYLPYIGLDGFKKYLEYMEFNNVWVNNSHIKALFDCKENELAKHYTEYHAMQLKARNEKEMLRREECRKKKEEEEKVRQQVIAQQISSAERKFKNREELENEDCDGTGIILCLMRKYGIKPPLKTQGWLNNTLAFVKWYENGEIYYSYYKKKGCNGSQTAFKYLKELENSINLVT